MVAGLVRSRVGRSGSWSNSHMAAPHRSAPVSSSAASCASNRRGSSRSSASILAIQVPVAARRPARWRRRLPGWSRAGPGRLRRARRRTVEHPVVVRGQRAVLDHDHLVGGPGLGVQAVQRGPEGLHGYAGVHREQHRDRLAGHRALGSGQASARPGDASGSAAVGGRIESATAPRPPRRAPSAVRCRRSAGAATRHRPRTRAVELGELHVHDGDGLGHCEHHQGQRLRTKVTAGSSASARGPAPAPPA